MFDLRFDSCVYVNLQWQLSRTDNDQVLEDYMEEVRREKILKGEISLLGVMQVSTVVWSIASGPILELSFRIPIESEIQPANSRKDMHCVVSERSCSKTMSV